MGFGVVKTKFELMIRLVHVSFSSCRDQLHSALK